MGNDDSKLVKTDWLSNFTLIGKPVINDFTFKIDKHSEKSDWVYNSMNLAVDCGEKSGRVFCELMGGYSSEREGVIYAHGKKDNGADDYSLKMSIAWEDRNDESILEKVGDRCFITVGLEKTVQGKPFYRKFLSAYDAIEYIQEHLTSDMVVNIKGNLKYTTYNDKTQIRKDITSIALISVDNPADYRASFTQTVLIDKDSASLKNIDKDKGVMYVDTYVLDYRKEYNGVDFKSNFPYPVQFEYAMDFTNPEQCKKIVDKLFKVKKGITQITFDGEFIESGASVRPTLDEIPDDVRDLIGVVWTEEEAIEQCSVNGSRERRMVFVKPMIKIVGDETKTPVLQVFPEKFTEEDLIINCEQQQDDVMDDIEKVELSEIKSDDDSMVWLDDLV